MFAAVAEKGFTDRQAGFLVTVMLHSGVCVGRQYCVYARIVHGQKVHDFFSSLVARRLATPYAAAHRRARIYHVHSKRLYAAIGEPNNRNRKPVTLARAVERLMVLDAVLAEPQLRWLGSRAREGGVLQHGNDAQVEGAAPSGFGAGPDKTIRHFPDKLPIGVTADGRTHVFLYLVNRDARGLPAFLHRHAELLRALPEWELRLLVPRHLVEAAPLFEAAAREELAGRLRLDDVAELRWYFRQQDAGRSRRRARGLPALPARVSRVSERRDFTCLYRLWKKNGDAARARHGVARSRGRDRAATEAM